MNTTTPAGLHPRRRGPLVNRLVVPLLSSRAHALLSGMLLRLTVRGHLSGQPYTFPVMYAVEGADVVVLVGEAKRKTWWRNLTDPEGTPVRLRLAGRDLDGIAHVLDGRRDPLDTAAALRVWLTRFPRAGSRLGAGRVARTGPTGDQLAQLAEHQLVVRITTAGPLPRPSALSRGRWVAACLGGEILGIAATATVMGTLNATVGEPNGAAARFTVWVAMVAAGCLEGLALGGLQWRALRRQLPRLPARRFVGVTVALAALGWAIGMLPSTLSGGGGDAGAGPAAWLLLLLAIGGGLAAGAAFGAGQAWALRGYATGGRGWIGVNALAWTAALAWIGGWAALPGSGWPTWAIALTGVAAGTGSGLLVGLVTSTWLSRLRPLGTPGGG